MYNFKTHDIAPLDNPTQYANCYGITIAINPMTFLKVSSKRERWYSVNNDLQEKFILKLMPIFSTFGINDIDYRFELTEKKNVHCHMTVRAEDFQQLKTALRQFTDLIDPKMTEPIFQRTCEITKVYSRGWSKYVHKQDERTDSLGRTPFQDALPHEKSQDAFDEPDEYIEEDEHIAPPAKKLF